MQPDDFEARMREHEYFHGLKLLPRTWCVIRVDGRSFSRFTEEHFEKPFDIRFHEAMVGTATELLTEMQGVYGYTESDEISILLKPDWSLFDRELEKLVSISAGIASANFALKTGKAAHFDSRVWMAASFNEVVDYFRWRQSDATRCALNGACYWALRKEGKNESQATKELKGQTVAFKNELLFQRGINFNELPAWQRRGVGLVWERYQKEASNPLTGEKVLAERRRIAVVEELPMKDEYSAWLEKQLGSAA
jgi:tRNA(His) 5'-end guanylyltransferase